MSAGLLAYLTLTSFIRCTGDGTRSSRTHNDFNFIGAALRMFHTHAGRYPTTEEGLRALVHPPATLKSSTRWKRILDEIPTDPWQNPYQYIRGPACPDEFGLYSLGLNGLLDLGDGPSDDIYSWEEDPPRFESHRRRPWTFHLACGLLLGCAIPPIFTRVRNLFR